MPDRSAVRDVLDTVRRRHGTSVATAAADTHFQAWEKSTDYGPDAGAVAAAWLLIEAARLRLVGAAPVALSIDLLAELAAVSWLEECTVRRLAVPDYPPDPEESPVLFTKKETPPMLDVADPTPQPPPDAAIARRLSEVADDDLRSYAATGGDLSLWPPRWNAPRVTGSINPPNLFHIPRPLRPHYYRSVERDNEVLTAWTGEVGLVPDFSEWPPTGPPMGLTINEPDLLLHHAAMTRAVQSLRSQERADRDAADQKRRTCSLCRTVQSIWITSQRNGSEYPDPGLCAACAASVGQRLADLRRARVGELDDQQTPAGRRGDLVAAFVERLPHHA